MFYNKETLEISENWKGKIMQKSDNEIEIGKTLFFWVVILPRIIEWRFLSTWEKEQLLRR